MESGKVENVALDVWENEPDIMLPLLYKVYIATPHIAGYSAEGKMNASRMMVEAFARYTNYSGPRPLMQLPAPVEPCVRAASMPEALLSIYNPLTDTLALKNAPQKFEALRNNYNLRREPAAFKITIE